MKKILCSILLGIPMIAVAQTAVDAYSVSQTDLKGTARYMSMAGAFGALGGDLSAINQNPGGIGVYRSSDIGLTLDLDLQSTKSTANGLSSSVNQTKFTCNNFGYVGAYKLDSETVPYINWGFSYNRPISYNRRYSGKINDIRNSLSNYVADVTNAGGYTASDLGFGYSSNGDVGYDPYIDSNAPWMSILAYNSFIINPENGRFCGLKNYATTGFSEYEVVEEGGVDEFNMNFGGNVADMLYWGFSFGLSNLEFNKYTYYGEGLDNATVVTNELGDLNDNGTASFGLENWLNTSGDGWNFKLGVIFKPVNELRFGLAFHTPTYWRLKDAVYSTMSYKTVGSTGYEESGLEEANAGYVDEVEYKIKTPWKFNASVAAVVGSSAIVSFDYERVAYDEMNIEYDYGYGSFSEDAIITNSIKDYYQPMNIYRIGAEYRLSPRVSLRLGYAYQSSPVNEDALNGNVDVITAGTTPAYTFDKSTQYITGGLGYRYKGFYTDLAYVHKSRKSEYSAFSGIADETPKATIKDNNNQFVWSIGYRF